jgi:hypothetical protein
MKTCIQLLVIIAWVFLPNRSNSATQWGSPTNGIQLGVELTQHSSSVNGKSPLCIVFVKNVGTNLTYVQFSSARDFRVDLVGPNGWSVEATQEKWIEVQPKPQRHLLASNAVHQLTFFYVQDVFSIKAERQYRLEVVSKFIL